MVDYQVRMIETERNSTIPCNTVPYLLPIRNAGKTQTEFSRNEIEVSRMLSSPARHQSTGSNTEAAQRPTTATGGMAHVSHATVTVTVTVTATATASQSHVVATAEESQAGS